MSVFETIDTLINDYFKRYLSIGDAEPIAFQDIMKYNMKLFKGKRELYTSRENKERFVKSIETFVIGKCNELKDEAIKRHAQGTDTISYIGAKWKEWQHVFEKMHDAMIHIADVYTSAIEPGIVYGPCTTRTLFVKKLSRIFINHVFSPLKEIIVSEIASTFKSDNRENSVKVISGIVDITIRCGEMMLTSMNDDKFKFYIDIIETPYLHQVQETFSRETKKFLMEPEFSFVAEKTVQLFTNEVQMVKRYLAPRTVTELKRTEIKKSVGGGIKDAIEKNFPLLLKEFKAQYEKSINDQIGKGESQIEKTARNVSALVEFSLDAEFNKRLASSLRNFFGEDVYSEIETNFKALSTKAAPSTVSSASDGATAPSSGGRPVVSQPATTQKKVIRRVVRQRPRGAPGAPAQSVESPAPTSQPISNLAEKTAEKAAAPTVTPATPATPATPVTATPQNQEKGLALHLTDAIIHVYNKYKYLIDTLFNGDVEFKKAMRDSFRIMFQKEKLPKMASGPKKPDMKVNDYNHQVEIIIPIGIANFVMKSLNKRDGVNKQELVNDFLTIYDFLPAKDVFIEKYTSLLEYYVITTFPRCFIDYHKIFVDELSKKSADVSVLKTFFTEIDESIPLTEKFCCAYQEYKNFSTLVLGSNHNSLVALDKEFGNFKMCDVLASYENKFIENLDGKGNASKKYELIKTSSIVEIEMKHDHGRKTTIVCNAIQAQILMLLNKGDQTVGSLVKGTGLGVALIEPILKTLQEKGIILPLSAVVSKEPVRINRTKMPSRTATIDIARTMMVVHEDVDNAALIAKRVSILKANIVRIMKANKQLPFHELNNKVFEATQKWFAATIPLMKKAIEESINQSFIKVVTLNPRDKQLWGSKYPGKNIKEIYEYIS